LLLSERENRIINQLAENTNLGAGMGFGLLSAATFGAGDFCGGVAGKRAPVYSVIISTQVVGLALLLVCALVFQDNFPPVSHLLIGGVMGIIGAAGLFALYSGLATGKMSVVAPVSALVATLLPLGFAVLQREPITLSKGLGFAFALVSVWFVSRTDSGAIRLRDLRLPVIAGIGFGLFYIIGESITDVSRLWPLVAARIASLTLLLTVATVRGQRRFVPREMLRLTALGGMLDAGGNALYILSVQAGGLISVAAVLSSLYPAMTVLLARFILHEKLIRAQIFGVVAALVAIVLISI
jgi:drug/metabolite transporter (DMT)-like permease